MSETTLVVLLPPAAEQPLRWLRLNSASILARGEGAPPPGEEDERVVAVAPAEALSLHWAELPGLAPAQARAAARLLASENSIEAIESLHVAVGDGDEERPIAAVSSQRMGEWLARLQAEGLDPDSIVPAPLLLPRPDEGYVSGDFGDQQVIRGRNSGFADDPALTPHIVRDAPVRPLDREALERSILDGVAAPELDLRQGVFAKRQRWTLDWPLVRRLAWLGAGVLAVTLLLSLVLIARYNFAAERLERRAEAEAREALPAGRAGSEPALALENALSDVRGGGLGFSATAGAVFGAVQATPNVELSGVEFLPDGTLRITVTAPGAPEANALKAAIERMGFTVAASPFAQAGGRISGQFTVSTR